MPKLVKNGAIVEDRWPADHIKTLEQWQALPGKAGTAVQLEHDQPPAPLLGHLGAIQLVAIHFSNFMDGRGFSYARELREGGYTGELRATGSFLPDQLHYLKRCGFDSFEFSDEIRIEDIHSQLNLFDEHYQGACDEPKPLFRRRG